MKISIDLDHTIIDYSEAIDFLSRKHQGFACDFESLRCTTILKSGELGWRLMQQEIYLKQPSLYQLFPYVKQFFDFFSGKIFVNSVRSQYFYSTDIEYLEPSVTTRPQVAEEPEANEQVPLSDVQKCVVYRHRQENIISLAGKI